MKPCLLPCCLIVHKIKMELSSQISDISGDLIPQQLFGIQQGASAFFLGLFFPSAWSSAFPAGRNSLFSVSTCLPNRLTLAQGFKNYWSVGGRKRDECKDTPRDLIWMFPRGAIAKSLQLLLSHFSSSLCIFPSPTPTQKHHAGRRNLGFGNESPSQHFSSWDSFLFGNSARKSSICNTKPNKLNLF